MAADSRTFTADFREAFEADRTALLRRRFMWWTGTVAVLQGLGVFGPVFLLLFIESDSQLRTIGLLGAAVEFPALVVFLVALFHMKQHATRLMQKQVLRIASIVILIAALLDLAAVPIGAYAQHAWGGTGNPALTNSASLVATWASGIMVSHIFACLFLPWTWREALWLLRWVYVVALVFVGGLLAFRADMTWPRALFIAVALPFAAAPGTAIAFWKHSRYRKGFLYDALRGKYGEMKRELYDAQRVHESLFPAPIEEGAVQVRYAYEPMRQIGGDFVYAVVTGEGEHAVGHIVVIDVTGHGITAALTVNRLYGEIRRELAEEADLTPGELLGGINAYIHNTLAEHSVYATALCVRIDMAAGELKWASAGHPPAFMLSIDGTLTDLDSTTLVLGAARGEDFQANEKSMRFGAGDRVVAYTDGATEARDIEGKMLGIAGIRALVDAHKKAGDGRLVLELMDALQARRVGPTQDDTLVVEVKCPLGV